MIPAEEAEAIVLELRANREAQPVGYISTEALAMLERQGYASISADSLVDSHHPLYTAPPAQVVNPELTRDWIACSKRLPETDGNYWGWWSDSKRQGPVWFIKSDIRAQFQSSEITHWMPLPAAPEGGN
jgi:hypothetical protein